MWVLIWILVITSSWLFVLVKLNLHVLMFQINFRKTFISQTEELIRQRTPTKLFICLNTEDNVSSSLACLISFRVGVVLKHRKSKIFNKSSAEAICNRAKIPVVESPTISIKISKKFDIKFKRIISRATFSKISPWTSGLSLLFVQIHKKRRWNGKIPRF